MALLFLEVSSALDDGKVCGKTESGSIDLVHRTRPLLFLVMEDAPNDGARTSDWSPALHTWPAATGRSCFLKWATLQMTGGRGAGKNPALQTWSTATGCSCFLK